MIISVLLILSILLAILATAVHTYVKHWEREGYFRTITYSRNGDRILTLEGGAEIQLWDANTGKEIRTMRKPYSSGGADYIAFSQDGRQAVTGGTDGIILWDVEAGQMVHLFENTRPATAKISGPCVEFSPDGQYILSGGSEHDLILWNTETHAKVRAFATGPASTETTSNGDVRCITFSPDGRFALTAGGRLILWNVATGRITRVFRGHKKTVISAAISNDNRLVVSGSYDCSLKTWSIESGEAVRSLHLDHFPQSIAFSPDGSHALSGEPRGSLKLWDLTRGALLFVMQSTEGRGVLSIAVRPDGQRVAAGLNGSLKLWDINTGDEILTFKRKVTLSRITQSIIWKYVRI